jgi:hypothetical protein
MRLIFQGADNLTLQFIMCAAFFALPKYQKATDKKTTQPRAGLDGL